MSFVFTEFVCILFESQRRAIDVTQICIKLLDIMVLHHLSNRIMLDLMERILEEINIQTSLESGYFIPYSHSTFLDEFSLLKAVLENVSEGILYKIKYKNHLKITFVMLLNLLIFLVIRIIINGTFHFLKLYSYSFIF